MISESIELSKSELLEVIKAYNILNNFIQKHILKEEIYSEEFLKSMDLVITELNQNNLTPVSNFESFIN